MDRINKQNIMDPFNEISVRRGSGHVDYSVKMLRRYVYPITLPEITRLMMIRSSFDIMQQRL